MLQLVNISRLYKQKKGPVVKALDNVNLTFNEKGLVFILGKSGSGKSTLLNVIGGLDKYTSGELFIKGKSANDFKQNEFDSYRNTMIGFIFQEYNLLNDFTVGQNIAIALELQGKKAKKETVNEYLTLLDMHGYAHRKTNTLSGGQKQRVAIARALIKDPDIIMADEPTGALDSVTGRQLFEILRRLADEKLVIVVTHDHEFAETYGDRIIEFSDGQVIRDISKSIDETTKQILFNQDAIEIRGNYELSNEDLVKINEYIRQKKSGVKIQIDNESNFAESPAIEPYERTNKIALIKSRLPNKAALKMGVNALKHKRFRLALSILLASVAFGMFGFTNAMANYNPRNVTFDEMINQSMTSSRVSKVNRYSFNDDGDYYTENRVAITDEDISYLNSQKMSENDVVPLIDYQIIDFSQNIYNSDEYSRDPFSLNRSALSLSATYFPSVAALEKTSATLIAGVLPQAKDEIAIPKIIYEFFNKYNYKNLHDSSNILIPTPEALLGKKLGYDSYAKTIVGIFDSNFDSDKYIKLVGGVEAEMNFFAGQQGGDYISSGLHYVFLVGKDDYEAVTKGPTKYVSNKNGYFSGQINVTAPDGMTPSIYLSSAGSIEEVKNEENVLFVGTNQKNMTFAKNQIVLPYSYIIADAIPDFNQAVADKRDGLFNAISSESGLDQIVYQFLVDYGNIPANYVPAGWEMGEKMNFYFTYANAIFDEKYFFYKNPYEPARTGAKLLLPYMQTELAKINRIPLTFDYYDYNLKYDNTPVMSNLEVVGLQFRFGNYSDDIGVYISAPLAAELNYVKNGSFSSALVFHGANRTNITTTVDLTFKGYNAKEDGTFYRLQNQVTSSVATISTLMTSFAQIFTILGVVFAVFAALLLMNFITLSVSFKKQEVGILRAIGARGIDVSRIFMNEAAIIGLINFTLATALLIGGSLALNTYFMQSLGTSVGILSIGILQIGLILLLSLSVSLVASFIPVYRLTLKKPIDAIKNS